ncbi:hypothetical protein CRUP_024761, partial [Coryphaenoides rupestris]
TQSGVSIINGNWRIDRPGVVVAVGTQLTYRRPNEIRSRIGESITAPGPLTQDLHVYLIYQQPDPSVYYEYMETVDPAGPHKDSSIGDISSNEIPKDPPHPRQAVPEPEVKADPLPAYRWSRDGHTACSTTCGTDSRGGCQARRSQSRNAVSGALVFICGGAVRYDWDLGEWSECSRRCGPGTQRRQVICRRVTHAHANGTEAVATVGAELCGASDGPVTKASCQLKICSQWRIRSEWSSADVRHCGGVWRLNRCYPFRLTSATLPCDLRPRERTASRSPALRNSRGGCQARRSQSRNAVSGALVFICGGAVRYDWDLGEWSECSRRCGPGTQRRQVICRRVTHAHANGTEAVATVGAELCGASDGPGDVEEDSECNLAMKPESLENCDMGACARSWFTSPWSRRGEVNQLRAQAPMSQFSRDSGFMARLHSESSSTSP